VSDPATPRKIEGLTGTVGRGPFGSGSKSQREGLWLETSEGRYALRCKDGPSAGDTGLEKFVGRKVACDGFIVDHMVLAEHIKAID
jgi:hypothetical protein